MYGCTPPTGEESKSDAEAVVGSLLALSQVLGRALKETPGAEDRTCAALPDGTQMPGGADGP